MMKIRPDEDLTRFKSPNKIKSLLYSVKTKLVNAWYCVLLVEVDGKEVFEVHCLPCDENTDSNVELNITFKQVAFFYASLRAQGKTAIEANDIAIECSLPYPLQSICKN